MKARLLAAALLCVPAWACCVPAVKPMTKETLVSDPSAQFCLPQGWRRADSGDGILILGPAREGVRAFISATFYAAGQGEYKNAQDYIGRYQKPAVKVNSAKTGPVEPFRVGGKPARRFIEDTVAFIPPSSMDTKEIPVREEHVLLERKGGFYVLVLHAARSDFKKQRPAFQAVLASFQPKP